MYEKHFGLERSPFRAKATGADVFVGPQTASTMAGFRKALATQDAVVTVSGPVGTGKTTLVERAVDAMGTKYKTIRVGRMAMDSSDVLEALLVVLGVQDRPAGTIQRFAALRKKLKELQDRDVRVFILIEDALRAGIDTLAELEALTAADAGESDGASIVIMGDERLAEFMQSPQLGQLQQRIRQRHTIYPQCGAEMRAYLMHCFRQVGGDFEGIFDGRSVALLKELSGGVPRIANNLIESTLAAAAAKGLDTIPATLIAEVASAEYGLMVEDFDFTSPSPEPSVAEAGAEAAIEPIADTAAARQADQPAELESETAATDVEQEAVEPVDDSPRLIHDTLPDLEVLSPNYAELAKGDDNRREAFDVIAPQSEAVAEVTPEPEPEAEPEAEPEPEEVAEIVPEPEPEAVAEIIPEPEPEAVAEIIPEPQPEAVAEEIPELEPTQDAAEEIAPQLMPEPVQLAVNDIEHMNVPEMDVTGDMTAELTSVPEPGEAETSIPEPVAALSPEALAEDIPELIPELSPVPLADVVPDHLPESESLAVADDIPELAPEPEVVADLIPELKPEPAAEFFEEITPELVANPEPVLAIENADISESPEWEQEPTFAELKPDLDALEQAMAFAQGASTKQSESKTSDEGSLYDRVTMCEEMPEITLDKTIETGIENMQADDGDENRPMTPLKKSAAELDKIASEIGMASTLEDFDDKMAETLFGTGISMIAAQLTIKQPTREPANDEIRLELETPTPASPPPAMEPPSASPVAEASEEITLTSGTPVDAGAMLPTATQRLKTVRALNAAPVPSSQKAKPAPVNGPTEVAAPAPIEDQIKTSITQTLKALEIPDDLEDDEPEEAPKRGFFSRFRRS